MNGLPENSQPDVQSVSPEDGERLLNLLLRMGFPLSVIGEKYALEIAQELDRSLNQLAASTE